MGLSMARDRPLASDNMAVEATVEAGDRTWSSNSRDGPPNSGRNGTRERAEHALSVAKERRRAMVGETFRSFLQEQSSPRDRSPRGSAIQPWSAGAGADGEKATAAPPPTPAQLRWLEVDFLCRPGCSKKI